MSRFFLGLRGEHLSGAIVSLDSADSESCRSHAAERDSWTPELTTEIVDMFDGLSGHVDLERYAWAEMKVTVAPARKPLPYRPRHTGQGRGRPTGTGKNTQRAEALALIAGGVSMRAAALRVGVDRTTVKRWRDAVEEKRAA